MDISVKELKEKIDSGQAPVMIDVRNPFEWDQQHLEGVKKITLGTIPVYLNDLKEYKDQEIVMICRSGGRSGQATAFLKQQGFSNVRNLAGGMLAWKAHIDPTFDVS
ncbi:MAG: rhodanese-like domain-containing protein [Bacteroidetes bacterium]|nr:rhodanese-like domain-containing protein [Bacteroidota bacterium]